MNAERKSGFWRFLPGPRSVRGATPTSHDAAPEPRALSRLVIVGNGMVSHRLCAVLARLGASSRYAITVLGDEPYLAYDRIHLSRYVTGGDRSTLRLAPRTWYSERDIAIYTGDEAVAIDREARTVTASSGKTYAYDRLVLVTGAIPTFPSVSGLHRESAYVYRTISDLEAIKSAAVNARSVAIIGGGLLGLEAAQALQALGLKTHVVENANHLLPRQLDAGGAAQLCTAVEALGISVLLGKSTARVDHHQRGGVTLHFTDETTLTADMLVVSAGVRPRDGLAEASGLACGAGGGVLVNDRLITTDPAILAAGDCVNFRGTVYGLVGPGYQMAEVVAANLMGARRRFRESGAATRLKLLGVDVASLGDALQPGQPLVFSDSTCYRMLNFRSGRLIGAIGTGAWPELGRIQTLIERCGGLSRWQRNRFLKTGNAFAPGSEASVTAWPDDVIACNCVGITCGQLRAAAADGIDTADRVREELGATTVCNSCTERVAQLIAAPAVATRSRRGWRRAWFLAALAVVAAWLGFPGSD